MTRKSALLFLLMCGFAGVATFLGSVVGHFLGTTGVFAGAISGGIVGVFVAARVAVSRQILGPKRFAGATIGGVLGLILAAEIATHNMSTPLVPLASILLIGLGAVFGAASRHGKSIAD
jgi:peptidoglycan/LPS O-acetylase OafA/YrhL